MTPTMERMLRHTPGSMAGSRDDVPSIARAAGVGDMINARIAMGTLHGSGYVERMEDGPRLVLYCRTPEGDRVVGGGR